MSEPRLFKANLDHPESGLKGDVTVQARAEVQSQDAASS